MTQARGPFRRVLRLVATNPRRWRRVYESMHPASIAARSVVFARRDLGYSEDPPGSNQTKFGEYWKQDGVPWCGMAVAFWWQRAGFQIDRELALQLDYVPALVRLAQERKHGLFIVGRNRVRAGDAVAFDFPGGERADHVGLFVRWIDKKAGAFEAIEGNTSNAGSQSNGGSVLLKTRSIGQVAAFVRKVR
jgi:hypothetical protein